MIRYRVPSRKKFEAEIERQAPGWLEEARRRTAAFKAKKEYFEPPDPNWSRIKPVYMKLQFNKCAYCEVKLSGGERGNVEHDIEHYRPKKNVGAWPNKKRLKKLGYDFPTGDKGGGYYLLPYNIFNYATSCKICNSTLKRDFFPVSGARVTHTDAGRSLKSERPFLLNPLAPSDDDPEELIVFGPQPGAAASSAPLFLQPRPNPALTDPAKIRRARVTIDFFELDIREPLIKQRAEVVKKMFEAFRDEKLHPEAERRKRAAKDIKRWQEASSPHASCARSFHKLCLRDLKAARAAYDAALAYIDDHPDL